MVENIVISEEASAKGTERALAILELLGRFRKGQSSSEIGHCPWASVNTVGHNRDHDQAGWLYRREDDRKYVLTNRVADLTRPQVNDKSLVVTSWDALRELRDRTGETTQLLAVRRQGLDFGAMRFRSGDQGFRYGRRTGSLLFMRWGNPSWQIFPPRNSINTFEG